MKSSFKYLLLFVFGLAHVTDCTGSDTQLLSSLGGMVRCPVCSSEDTDEVRGTKKPETEYTHAHTNETKDPEIDRAHVPGYIPKETERPQIVREHSPGHIPKETEKQQIDREHSTDHILKENEKPQIDGEHSPDHITKENDNPEKDGTHIPDDISYEPENAEIDTYAHEHSQKKNLRNDGAKFRCDYKYCSYSKAWFKYHVIPATWRDARLMCTLEGGILASPSTLEIRATMTKSTGVFPIFTGLHATFSKGKFYTVDGIPLDEIHHTWASHQPNNVHNGESCLALDSQGQFADVSCEEPRPYMCYRNATADINECGTHDNEYVLDSRTKQCYKFHRVPRDFGRAHFTCSAEGGHLAIINSQEEAHVLRDLFAKNPGGKMTGNFWKDVAYIGFSTWGEGGDWRTIHGQTLSEAGYDKWSPGEPNNSTGGEFCGAIYRTAWLNDLWCEKQYAFICEKKPDYPAVCDNNLGETEVTAARRGYETAMAMLKAARQRPMSG